MYDKTTLSRRPDNSTATATAKATATATACNSNNNEARCIPAELCKLSRVKIHYLELKKITLEDKQHWQSWRMELVRLS
jgi:hypothetical protein